MPNWVSKPSAVLPFGTGHDSGVGDHEVERLARIHQGVGARTHAGERCKIEPDQLESAPTRHRPNVLGRRVRFSKVPRSSDDVRAAYA